MKHAYKEEGVYLSNQEGLLKERYDDKIEYTAVRFKGNRRSSRRKSVQLEIALQ